MEEKIRLAVAEEYSNILGIVAYKDNEKYMKNILEEQQKMNRFMLFQCVKV